MGTRHSSLTLAAFTALCLFTSPGAARPPTAWSQATQPSAGKAKSIGGYSAGCIQGAEALPTQGTGYRVMKPERKRHFGHPRLVAFVEKLAKELATQERKPLGVGDLGQPRGGPAPSGHASHQSGLDVDLWFSPGSPGSTQHPMVDLAENRRSEHWTTRVAALLKFAGSAREVARVFVNPLIKKELCEAVEGDRSWLRKLRPWYGHHEHFHVRLSCPTDSPDCKNQGGIPAGDGCGELDWWLSAQHKKDRQSGGAKYSKRVGAKPPLPAACTPLIKKVHGNQSHSKK